MKITVPDDVETFTEEDVESDPPVKDVKKTFQQEIREILQISKIPSKFIVDRPDSDSPDIKLQVLLKFTQLCREEIIPRHVKAMETIQSKSQECQLRLAGQEQELALLLNHKRELQQISERLEETRVLVRARDQDLRERVKDTVQKLQTQCKSKSLAEIKMAADLKALQDKAKNLQVEITSAKCKTNYYKTQVKAQTDLVTKHVKPLYLDKNRTDFMKTNLNTMRHNIEDLVGRVKILKTQVTQLADPEYFAESNTDG